MTIKVGDKVPSVNLAHMTESGPGGLASDALFGGRKVVMFAVPGAFTPTCSAAHLPGSSPMPTGSRRKAWTTSCASR